MAKDNLEKKVDELTDKASKKQKGSLDKFLLLKEAAAILAMIERKISKMNKAIAKAVKAAMELDEKRKAKKAAKETKKREEKAKQKELEDFDKKMRNLDKEDKKNEQKKLISSIPITPKKRSNKKSVIPDCLNSTESLAIVESLKNSVPEKKTPTSSIKNNRPNF